MRLRHKVTIQVGNSAVMRASCGSGALQLPAWMFAYGLERRILLSASHLWRRGLRSVFAMRWRIWIMRSGTTLNMKGGMGLFAGSMWRGYSGNAGLVELITYQGCCFLAWYGNWIQGNLDKLGRMYPDFSLRLLATFASGRIFLTFLHKRYRKGGFAALDVWGGVFLWIISAVLYMFLIIRPWTEDYRGGFYI